MTITTCTTNRRQKTTQYKQQVRHGQTDAAITPQSFTKCRGTDTQGRPLLHYFPLGAQPTCTIQNMSNEERWDYIRETFQKLSSSHLYAGLERRRIQGQSYLPCQSPRNTSLAHWESSFDVSTVDFNDLLNETSYRAQEIVQGS